MTITADVLAFGTALGIAAAIPGPGITALVARTVSGGKLAGYALLIGLIIGDLVFLCFAVFGLGLLAHTYEFVFSVIRWFSIGYLFYLAWRFWVAEYQTLSSTTLSVKSLLTAGVSGFAITLSNPKAIAFYVAIVPLVLDLENISVSTLVTVLAPTTIFVLLLVGSFYILGVESVRQALSSVKAQQRLHRVASLAMAAAAISILLREF